MKSLRPQVLAAIVLLFVIAVIAMITDLPELASMAGGGIIAGMMAIIQLDEGDGE